MHMNNNRVARTLLFTLLVPGSVTVLVPMLLLAWVQPAVVPGSARWWGLPLIAGGAAVYAWCAADFVRRGSGTPSPTNPPVALVRAGLYRYTRNPMYVGIVGLLLGEAIVFQSVVLCAYAAAIAVAFHLRVVLYEERRLGTTFGEAYRRYCAEVPRWMIRPPGIGRTR